MGIDRIGRAGAGAALAASLDALERFRILPEHLEGISFPVLMVTGPETPDAEKLVAERLASWIPNVQRMQADSLPGGTPFGADDGGAASAITGWIKEHLGER